MLARLLESLLCIGQGNESCIGQQGWGNEKGSSARSHFWGEGTNAPPVRSHQYPATERSLGSRRKEEPYILAIDKQNSEIQTTKRIRCLSVHCRWFLPQHALLENYLQLRINPSLVPKGPWMSPPQQGSSVSLVYRIFR